MRSVLIAIDFVKDVDNSFKILELNTGIAFAPKSIEPYFNKSDFDTFLSENNITEIELVLLNEGPVYAINSDYPNDPLFGFGLYFDKYYSGLTIDKIVVDVKNQIMPTLNDSPNKLIIRQCYDSTALIDETYAKDNFEFLKLLYDSSPNSIAKTYFDHPSLGFDMIGTTLKDNGNHPNYIVKQRYPTTNYTEYPKVYKIETQEQLQTLKNTLPSNTLLQEYIINTDDLEDGKLKTYRSIGLVYGSSLDIINLIDPFVLTNNCSIDSTVDVLNGEIQVWERPKYLQKYNNRDLELQYNSDSTNLILKSDGSLSSPANLMVNDEIKSIVLPGLMDSDEEPIYSKYSGDTDSVFSGSTLTSSKIVNIDVTNKSVWLKKLILEDGLVFSDIDEAKILIKRNNVLIFVSYYAIEDSDEIVVVNKNTNEFESKTITSISYSFSNETIYSIDVEDVDIYLTMDESIQNPNYFIIQHNGPACQCWYLNAIGDYWECADPCVAPPNIYTGYNFDECFELGLSYPYCQYLVCCRTPLTAKQGAYSLGPCSNCDYNPKA